MTEMVAVVGQGYVGLPMALRIAEAGQAVIGFDVNRSLVDALNEGRSHIDDVSDSELQTALRGSFRASADPEDLARATVILVCVPTPLSQDGGPDLAPVRAAAETIGRHVSSGTLCILESTTYPGTTEEVFAPLVCGSRLTVGRDVFIAFSPERIDPGNTAYGVQNTPKVVGGLTPECGRRAKAFYSSFVDTVVEARGAKEAEMAKLLENTFRHVNIALVNEMLRFSRDLDIDLWDAIDCAATKPFGFMAFRPGPGVGGHCIPVDPSYLSHRVKAKLGYAFRMVELAEEINTAAPQYVADRARDLLNEVGKPVKGSKILLLGVTYKANISDRRESPADPLARRLLGWGADLAYHDPFVERWSPNEEHGADNPVDLPTLTCVPDLEAAVQDADVVILLQSHSSYDLARLSDVASSLLDTRGVVPETSAVHRL